MKRTTPLAIEITGEVPSGIRIECESRDIAIRLPLVREDGRRIRIWNREMIKTAFIIGPLLRNADAGMEKVEPAQWIELTSKGGTWWKDKASADGDVRTEGPRGSMWGFRKWREGKQ